MDFALIVQCIMQLYLYYLVCFACFEFKAASRLAPT